MSWIMEPERNAKQILHSIFFSYFVRAIPTGIQRKIMESLVGIHIFSTKTTRKILAPHDIPFHSRSPPISLAWMDHDPRNPMVSPSSDHPLPSSDHLGGHSSQVHCLCFDGSMTTTGLNDW